MKRIVVAILALSFVAACGGGGGGGGGGTTAAPPPEQPPAAGPSPSEKLAEDLDGLPLSEFYEESLKALTYRSEESILWQGLTGEYPLEGAGLDDFSDEYRRETIAMYAVVLELLRRYGTESQALKEKPDFTTFDEELTYDFYEWYLQDRVAELDFLYHDFVATYNFHGIQSATERFFTDIHPVTTRQEALDYTTRLATVIFKFRHVIDYLTRQSGAGIIEPQPTLDAAIARLGVVADEVAVKTAYYTSFREKVNRIPGITTEERGTLFFQAEGAINNSVIPAYRELRQKLQSLRANAPASIGVGQYPDGAEYYAYTLRHHTTTDLTADEIHQLGLDELDRIHAEMRVIFDQLNYPRNETLQQLFARVTDDGGIIPAPDVKAGYEAIIAAAEQDVVAAFDIFPEANVIVAEDPFGGFYIGPSFDGTRPGAFYAGTSVDQPWFQMPSLSYHEAVPGHHTQIAIAMQQQDGPSFRRAIRFTAFVEGWALYAERLAYELGWYDNDPYGNLGRLQYEALRAARLVIDTGIHSRGWSFEQAVQFNEDNVGWSRGASEGAAGRYSVVPAQATAYMVGMLRILQARERAINELGMLFDLKEFHRAILTSGGVPLALLDAVVDNYIAEKLAAP